MSDKELLKAVKSTNKTYDKFSPKWIKTELVYAGEDEVHDAGDILLPKLEQQTPEQYNAYVERARFFNAFARTISGLEGTVTRKEPNYNIKPIEKYKDDIDGNGKTLEEYYLEVLNNMLVFGICGSLVDHTFSEDDLTEAEAEQQNQRPKLSFYTAKNILNWRYKMVNNSLVLSLLVLRELEEDVEEEFLSQEKYRYRVLRLDDEGKYYQQIYRDIKGSAEISDEIYPEIDGEKQEVIPFFFHGKYDKPPLYDLVTSNIKHYQLKADHNHGLHYIGLPTVWRTGVDADDPNLPKTIGCQKIWDLESKDAKVGILEFEGKGFEEVRMELDKIEEHMAFLGASMLSTEKVVNETATKANFRNASETSLLAKIVFLLVKSMNSTIQYFALWDGVENIEKVTVDISTDFDITKLTPQEILAYVQTWMSGGFAKRTLFELLQEGEAIDANRTFEEEEELINKGE